MQDSEPRPTWETHGWTAEAVRGYDWRATSARLHPQQHIGAHFNGVWNDSCRQCQIEKAALGGEQVEE